MIPSFGKIPPDIAALLTLGWSLAIWMALGVFAGRWLDHHGFTAPWGLLLGVFAGVAGCIYTILRTLKKLDKQA